MIWLFLEFLGSERPKARRQKTCGPQPFARIRTTWRTVIKQVACAHWVSYSLGLGWGQEFAYPASLLYTLMGQVRDRTLGTNGLKCFKSTKGENMEGGDEAQRVCVL